jgi:hypothetical protein
MKQEWSVSGQDYYLAEVSNLVPIIDKGIYELNFNPMRGFYLSKLYNAFHFPYKIYGAELKFVQRVIRSFNTNKSNQGVLLNGVKGTGKSVTAKLIANASEKPVILVNSNIEGFTSFLGKIQQDIVVFIDEFEKIFGDEDYESPQILTIMDGVFNSEFKKLFLFTTNNQYINQNLLQRPGRIRYVKPFGDLTKEVIEEIIEDSLINKDLKQDLIDNLKELEIITIDILKEIINECNIHNEPFSEFISYFNVKKSDKTNDIFQVTVDEKGNITNEIKMYSNVPAQHCKAKVRNSLYIEDDYLGVVRKIENSLIYVNDYEEDDHPELTKIYQIREASRIHHSYCF